MIHTINEIVNASIRGQWGEELAEAENGWPVIKTNNLTYDGRVLFTNLAYRRIDVKKHAVDFLKTGDLLIEKSGGTKTHSVGYAAFFDGPDDTYFANNFILVLRPVSSIVDSRFLFYQIRYKYESGQFYDCFNKTTGIQNLSVARYLAKRVMVPSLETQRTIAQELSNIDSLIKGKNRELSRLDDLIKSRFIERSVSV